MRLPELVLVLALWPWLPGPAVASAPTHQEVQQAVDKVRQHPDLGGTKREKTLRFKDKEKEREPAKRHDNPFEWLRGLGRWLSETARVLVWLAGAAAVAIVVVGLRRWIQVRAGLAPTRLPGLPSHVQDLDIRPESLPEAIGAAAAELWQRGEHRAALSLLYRGALSRLVHAHGVPIRAASTEGECVVLSRGKLDAQGSRFFAQLVGAWQLAVYGARLPDTQLALTLCRDFDLNLPAHAAAAAAP